MLCRQAPWTGHPRPHQAARLGAQRWHLGIASSSCRCHTVLIPALQCQHRPAWCRAVSAHGSMLTMGRREMALQAWPMAEHALTGMRAPGCRVRLSARTWGTWPCPSPSTCSGLPESRRSFSARVTSRPGWGCLCAPSTTAPSPSWCKAARWVAPHAAACHQHQHPTLSEPMGTSLVSHLQADSMGGCAVGVLRGGGTAAVHDHGQIGACSPAPSESCAGQLQPLASRQSDGAHLPGVTGVAFPACTLPMGSSTRASLQVCSNVYQSMQAS